MKKNVAGGVGLWWVSWSRTPLVAWAVAVVALVPAVASARGPIVSAAADWLSVVWAFVSIF